MKKFIMCDFGFDIETKARLKLIKEAGFDGVIVNSGKSHLTNDKGSFRYLMKCIKKEGLALSSLHMRYNTSNLPYFWEKGKIGDKVESDMIKDLKLAKKYDFKCLVVHLFADEFTEIGKERLLKILDIAEKLDIPIAIENIDRMPLFYKTFENINHPYMKFCHDVGHKNIHAKDYDFISNLGDKLIALHLHDNNGTKDLHTISKFGTIDWAKFCKEAGKILLKNNVSLDFELMKAHKFDLSIMTAEEWLLETKNWADKLEKMILKRQKEN